MTASPLDPTDRADAFADRHRQGGWGEESTSGPGSTLDQTAIIRREVPRLLRELHVVSMVDAPCGDLHWIKQCDLGVREYIGMDIVPDLIEQNAEHVLAAEQRFVVGDIVTDPLPRVDLILTRDCFVHLPFADVLAALQNFRRSGSTYLLTTTFTRRKRNSDLPAAGGWRPLNLTRAPFLLPPPLQIIEEGCTEWNGEWSDKSLGLWRLDALGALDSA